MARIEARATLNREWLEIGGRRIEWPGLEGLSEFEAIERTLVAAGIAHNLTHLEILSVRWPRVPGMGGHERVYRLTFNAPPLAMTTRPNPNRIWFGRGRNAGFMEQTWGGFWRIWRGGAGLGPFTSGLCAAMMAAGVIPIRVERGLPHRSAEVVNRMRRDRDAFTAAGR